MALVRVKTKYQLTLPVSVRKRFGINVGDLLEAEVKKGKITLTPQAAIDRELLRSLADVRAGRLRGPFDTVASLLRSLKLRPESPKKTKRRKRSR